MNFLRSCFEPDTTAGFTFQEPEPGSNRARASLPPPAGREGRHIPFSQHTRSLPNKLKLRQRRRQGEPGETDAYRDFLEKKQGQMEMWGETFREHHK